MLLILSVISPAISVEMRTNPFCDCYTKFAVFVCFWNLVNATKAHMGQISFKSCRLAVGLYCVNFIIDNTGLGLYPIGLCSTQ